MRIIFFFFLLLWPVCLSAASDSHGKNNVIVYPVPEGEVLNAAFIVSANGVDVPVYNVKVAKRKDYFGVKLAPLELEQNFEIAGFAYFDMKKGRVKITVSIDEQVISAKVLPSSSGIIPAVKGKTVSFEVDKPQNVTVEVNGDHVCPLHLFVNPEERDIPNPNDPNVIYFGPGIHEITSMPIGENKTVYIAGGAIVRGMTGADEAWSSSRNHPGLRHYGASFILRGKNITFRGRGILDQELVAAYNRRQMVNASVEGLKMEGVILRNSSLWSVCLRKCRNVHIDNIKIMGYRSNSDGIDICSSSDVLVENSFVRTFDDLIVVKTTIEGLDADRMHIRRCVLWNECAHALSAGAELRGKVEDVLFEECDVIADNGRTWLLRIFHCQNAMVKNVRFENIRIEEVNNGFASLHIVQHYWSGNVQERGHIEDVVFRNITVDKGGGKFLKRQMEFEGYDAGHAINHVLIDNIEVCGKKISKEDVVMNDYVYNVKVK